MLTAAWEQALTEATANKTTFADWLLHISPELHWDWPYIRYVREHLDRITSGKIHKLMIFMPPQHGKSALATIRYPVYRLERNPALRIIVGAYNQFLSEKFSRQARRLASYRMQLSPERTAAYDWETQQGGGMRAAGVGSGVTGIGGDLIIIDDPVKSREEAESQAYRDRVWDWYSNDLYTRQGPDAAFILIMCMTGDTPVLMADGTERPLREIKVGDQVATYDNGRLATSTVRNHRSNGLDSVFGIKTTCGKIVYANEQHPFLVQEHGQLKWIRLRNLTIAHRIVTVKDSGANGRERYASLKAARNLLAREAIALHTTVKRCGQTDIVHRPTTHGIDATSVLNGGTESPSRSTMQCSRCKAASVPFAGSRQETTCAHIGTESYVLTTATKRTRSGGFCATTVTLPWDMPKQRQPHSPLPNTSDFTTAQIESIELAGVEEVFDIQVERTENFIADGLVSHNTRWHKDDLAGRILDSDDGPNWTVISLPAEAEPGDPLGRAIGEALCPARFDVPALADFRRTLGRDYHALYQQQPRAREGGMFKEIWLPLVDAVPAQAQRVRWWDKGATAGGGDPTAGVLVAYAGGITYIEDVVRGQWAAGERDAIIRRTAEKDSEIYGPVTYWGEQEPGASGKDAAAAFVKLLAGFPVYTEPTTGSKETACDPLASQAEAGNVRVKRAAWSSAFIVEACDFPSGKHDDQIESAARAFNKLARYPAPASGTNTEARQVHAPKPRSGWQRG